MERGDPIFIKGFKIKGNMAFLDYKQNSMALKKNIERLQAPSVLKALKRLKVHYHIC
jgi:hypothetical protein